MERKLSSFAEADRQWKAEQDALRQAALKEHACKHAWKHVSDAVKRVNLPHPRETNPKLIFFNLFATALCKFAVHLKSQPGVWDKLRTVTEWCNPEGVEALRIFELAAADKRQDVIDELSQYHPWLPSGERIFGWLRNDFDCFLRGQAKDYNDFNRPETTETRTQLKLADMAPPKTPQVPVTYGDAIEQAVKWFGKHPGTEKQTRNVTMAWMADECHLSDAKIRDWWLEHSWPDLPTSPTTNKARLVENNIKTYIRRGRKLAHAKQES